MTQRQAEERSEAVDDEVLVRPFVRDLGASAVTAPRYAPAGPPPRLEVPSGPDTLPVAGGAGRHAGRRRRGPTVAATLLAVGLLGATAFYLADGSGSGAAPAPTLPSNVQAMSPPMGAPASRTVSVPAAPTAASQRASASASPAESSAPRPTGGAATAPGVLRPGDSGPAVVRLQQLLFAQGKTYVAADGRFDAATERAVREVQHERSITADPPGVYGAATRAALDGS
ncbi:peptidoglycan-binding protein [Streptomyces sp. NBC_01718]|uniref:peptidoglycan-binding domain-containing protein n=1 Tax=unclassified Streptomyces TaxID=2593676 RepID=UPI0030E3B0E0